MELKTTLTQPSVETALVNPSNPLLVKIIEEVRTLEINSPGAFVLVRLVKKDLVKILSLRFTRAKPCKMHPHLPLRPCVRCYLHFNRGGQCLLNRYGISLRFEHGHNA